LSIVVGAGCNDARSTLSRWQHGRTGTIVLCAASRSQHGSSQSATQHEAAAAARMPLAGITNASSRIAARANRLRRMSPASVAHRGGGGHRRSLSRPGRFAPIGSDAECGAPKEDPQ
jgi:hypothetical protein